MEITHERLTLGGHFPAHVEREHFERYKHAAPHVRGLNVLDLASGSGYGSHHLATAGALSVRGIDISPEAVEFARSNYSADNLRFDVGDAQNVQAVDEASVDAVVSFETIEHLPDVSAYLAEVHRVLKPGGTFIVSTPDRHFSTLYPITGRPNNKYHVREFSRREIYDLLSRQFHIKEWFGQSFVSRPLVFWPVQVAVKGACYAARHFGAYRLVSRWYRYESDLEVRPAPNTRWALPRFWIVHAAKSS